MIQVQCSTSRFYPNFKGVGRSSHGDDDVFQVWGAGQWREEGELLQQARHEEKDLSLGVPFNVLSGYYSSSFHGSVPL